MKTDIIPFDPDYADETVAMWRESKERAIGQKEKHSVENHLYFCLGSTKLIWHL